MTYWGVNHVDIAMWALGLEKTGPVEIEGEGRFPKIPKGFDVPVDFRCTLKFAGGSTIESPTARKTASRSRASTMPSWSIAAGCRASRSRT